MLKSRLVESRLTVDLIQSARAPEVSTIDTSFLYDSDPVVRRTGIEKLAPQILTTGEHETAIEALSHALTDPHVGVQEAAIQALVAFNGAKVASVLLPLLRGNVLVRNLAVEVLQQVDSSAIPIVLGLASDSDPHLRKFVAHILGTIGGDESVTGLLSLLNDPSPNVRMATVEAFGKLGDARAVDALIGAVQDTEEWVVFGAIGALGSIGDVRAVPTLKALLWVDETTIRGAVVEALGKLRDSSVLPDLLAMLPTAILPLRHLLFVTIVRLVGDRKDVFVREEMKNFLLKEMLAALHTRELEVQVAALEGLGLLGDPQPTDSLINFLKTCHPSEEALHEAVLNTLCQMGDDSCLITYATDPEESVALVCMKALAAQTTTQAIPVLGKLVVGSENREIRREALRALGKIGVMGVEGSIVQALNDLSGYVRNEAAKVVGERRVVQAETVLWQRLECEPYPDVLTEVVRALVLLGQGKPHHLLNELLKHDRVEVRETAVIHWPHGDPSALREVWRAHGHDPDWRVRVSIVERMGDQADQEVLEFLISASSDSHPYVRQAAVLALGKFPKDRVGKVLRSLLEQDADLRVRIRATEQLADQVDRESLPLFLTMVETAPLPLQVTLIRALADLGDQRAVHSLQRVRNSDQPEVVEAAGEALNRLGVLCGNLEAVS